MARDGERLSLAARLSQNLHLMRIFTVRQMSKESGNTGGSAGGTCAGCLKPQGAGPCRTCRRLEDTVAQVTKLRAELNRRREQLEGLLHGQVSFRASSVFSFSINPKLVCSFCHFDRVADTGQRVEENRRFQLFSLQERASDTRRKAQLTEQRLAQLNSSGMGAAPKSNNPRFANAVILQTAVHQVILNFI